MAKSRKKRKTASKTARQSTQAPPVNANIDELSGKTGTARRVARAAAREHWLRENNLWRPFDFMKLPPELRQRVYQYYFWECERDASLGMDRLSWTLLPDLCDTNRQVRQETIPLFFESTKFRIPVGSDVRWQVLSTNLKAGTHYRTNYERYRSTKDAGLILLSDRTERILQGAGPTMLFKHIVFEMFICEDIDDIWSLEDGGPEEQKCFASWQEDSMVASLHLDYEGGEMSCVAEQSLGLDSGLDEVCSAKVAKTMEVSMAAAKSLSTASGFNGFTFRDLETIAAAFRAG